MAVYYTSTLRDQTPKLPKLRFKNDDGLGFSEWEEKKLGDIVDVMQSGVSRMLSDADIGLPVIRSNNLINNKLDISDIKYWHTQDNQGVNLEDYFLKEGDLLVNFINSLAQIGKIALFENKLNRNTIFTTNLMRLSFGKNISSKYISCFFQTNNYINYIQAITKPAVNQASFTTKEFKALPIPLPSLPEQTKIASFLTAIDEKITQLTQKYDLLAQYKKGVMQQIFSQKLRFKDDDGREFPEWEEGILGDAFEYRNGKSLENEISDSGQFFLITLNSIDISGKLKADHKRVSRTDFSLIKNDLVMILSDVAHGNFLGLTDIIPSDKYVLNQRIGGLRAKINIDVRFVSSYINYNQKYFKGSRLAERLIKSDELP